MGREAITALVSIITAIIGVAIIATIVSQRAQTGNVIQAASSGFAQDLAAALSPVTGGSGSGNLTSLTSFTGGGASYLV